MFEWATKEHVPSGENYHGEQKVIKDKGVFMIMTMSLRGHYRIRLRSQKELRYEIRSRNVQINMLKI